IKPNLFQVRNCFFTNDKWKYLHENLLCSFFKFAFGSKFFSIPLFSPWERALFRSFILNSSDSKSLNAVLITSLAELYFPDDTLAEINSSKCSPSNMEVLRAIKFLFIKVPIIGISTKSGKE